MNVTQRVWEWARQTTLELKTSVLKLRVNTGQLALWSSMMWGEISECARAVFDLSSTLIQRRRLGIVNRVDSSVRSAQIPASYHMQQHPYFYTVQMLIHAHTQLVIFTRFSCTDGVLKCIFNYQISEEQLCRILTSLPSSDLINHWIITVHLIIKLVKWSQTYFVQKDLWVCVFCMCVWERMRDRACWMYNMCEHIHNYYFVFLILPFCFQNAMACVSHCLDLLTQDWIQPGILYKS